MGNLLDDLEAGELIESERTSKRTLSKKEEGSQIEYNVKEDERADILSRYVPSQGKESQVEKLYFFSLSHKKPPDVVLIRHVIDKMISLIRLSGISRNLPVRVEAPRLEDDNEWIKSDRSLAASQDYYQGEKKPVVDVNIIDDDSDDELEQKKTRSNTNRNNYQGRELNRSNNGTSDGWVRKFNEYLETEHTSLGSTGRLKSKHNSSRKTLTKSRQTGKGDILTSLGLAFDPENESFINNLNKFAVYKSDSMDQGGC